jgi:hydrogenase maturation protease
MDRDTAVVLAWGNPERRDDGVAWAVADELRTRLSTASAIRIETCLQLAPELADLLSSTPRALFIDAHASADRPDIDFRPLRPSKDPRLDLSHHMAPGALLALTRAAYGRAPDAALLGVRAHELDHATGLSDATTQLVPEAVARALEFLGQA